MVAAPSGSLFPSDGRKAGRRLTFPEFPILQNHFHNFNFERFFASTAHTKTEVDRSLEVIAEATKIVKDRLGSAPKGV